MSGNLLLSVSGLRKSYQRGSEIVHALEDVNMDLASGELAALVGRSGSGKTTLLNILAGWEEADEGLIRWADGLDDLSWKRVAVLPQSLGLVEELSVLQNIMLPVRLSGGSSTGDRSSAGGRAESLVDLLGLDALVDRYPGQISLGQQQRCSLARALVVRPALLLADEPTGHQDSKWAGRIYDRLREAASEGTCCLVVTHSAAITDHAQRVLGVKDGRLLTLEAALDTRP